MNKIPQSCHLLRPVLHLESFSILQNPRENTPFNTEIYLIEFEIGMTLSKMYNLPKMNYIPHRDHPTPYYQKTIQILKEYKLSQQELTKGKIKTNL